jgi:hypothetical protein
VATVCATPVNTSAITAAPTRLRAWLIPDLRTVNLSV